MTKAKLRSPAAIRVVFDGQSRLTSPAVPPHVMTGKSVPWVNVAKGGHGWYDLTADASTRLHRQARKSGTDILVLFGGEGDLWNASPSGQQSGATVYSRLTTYANAARTAGFDFVLVCTVPPAGPDVLGTGRPSPSEVQALLDYNDLIRLNAGDWDGVIDVATVLDDATDQTYFAIDRTHFNATGAQTAADLIRPVLFDFIDTLA